MSGLRLQAYGGVGSQDLVSSTTTSYSSTSSPGPRASSKLAAKGQLQQYNIQRLLKTAKNDTAHEKWQLQQECNAHCGMPHRLVCRQNRVKLWEWVPIGDIYKLTEATAVLHPRGQVSCSCPLRPSKICLCKSSWSHKASSNYNATQIPNLVFQLKVDE